MSDVTAKKADVLPDTHEELLSLIQKKNKKAEKQFYEVCKVGDFVHSKDEKEQYGDLFLVDLSNVSEKGLMTLHRHTDWLAATYFLRWRYLANMEQANEDVLLTLTQVETKQAKKVLYSRFGTNIEAASDETQVIMYQDGREDILDYLTIKHEQFVKKVVNKMDNIRYFKGYEKADLYQEGMLGYFKALKDYKIKRKTRFKDFARYVIEKHLDTIINKSTNNKNIVLNNSFSYHSPVDNEHEVTFEQMLKSNSYQPESTFVNKETYKAIFSKLTPLEKDVLRFYSEGLSYQEIGELVGKKKKAIDNTIQRIRKKGKMYMSNFL